MICTPKVGQLLEVHIFMSREKKFNTKYSAEFKISVIMDMRENHLGYCETVRKYGLGSTQSGGAINTLHRWERIYLEEGAAGLMTERRGRKSTGRPAPPFFLFMSTNRARERGGSANKSKIV